jgi:hypothetical protein
MRDFLFNLMILAVLGAIIFFAFPSLMKQIFGVYSGLGILPFFVLAVIIAALPRRTRRRR